MFKGSKGSTDGPVRSENTLAAGGALAYCNGTDITSISREVGYRTSKDKKLGGGTIFAIIDKKQSS
jgi:hypothetical protein